MPDSTGQPDPKRWHTREDSGLRLDRNGRWWHDQVLIEHPRIIEAFNRGLTPTEDGRFRLDFGNDWCFVEVEDAAYTVLGVEVNDGEGVSMALSDRTTERLDPTTLELDIEGALVCRVKEGRAKARFCRDAQFAFGSVLEETDHGPVLKIGGQVFPVPARASSAGTRVSG
jgi:hypothetical protein